MTGRDRTKKRRWKNNASARVTQKAPYNGPGADSEEKHEPASDIAPAVPDSLKSA
jgi:hypothetical protein